MEIIFVTSALHGGGAERVMSTLANRFVRQGDTVIILMVAGTEVEYALDEKVQLCSIGQPSHGNPLVQIKRLSDMRRYFKRHKDAVIVSFGTKINMFTLLAAFGLKNRVIVSERSDPNQCTYQKLRNLIYSLGKGFVFQTEAAMQHFPLKIQAHGVIIPNPLRNGVPEIYYGVREKKIAAVGRLEKEKNNILLIRAFAGFLRKHSDYELHFFGKGSLEQMLREESKKLGIDKKVVFEGFREDTLQQIRSYGMYVISSDFEGVSNSLIEALSLGLPCIATDCPIGGCAMCIQNGENGLLIPVGNVEALEKAMCYLAENAGAAEKMSKNAAMARERFAEEKVADMWYTFMENCGEEG